MKVNQQGADIFKPTELQTLVEEERPNIRKISDKKVRRALQEALAGASLRPVIENRFPAHHPQHHG